MNRPHARPDLDPAAAARIVRAVCAEDGAAAAPCARSVPGYVIERLLGQGGGGWVFRAFKVGAATPVALKVLRSRAGETEARRTWRELELLESLRLPHVPRLLDYGMTEGHLYFASEFVDGLTLEAHCLATGASQRTRVELLARVAEVVQELHEHGVVHRDIKPSNVIVTAAGAPVLVDFGLAVASGNETILTTEGTPVGTPAFMSPEQARGDRSAVTTRSDVYALGATSFVILTGSPPHDTSAPLHEAIRRVAQDPPREPRSLNARLPRALAAILSKACDPAIERRYASPAAFAEDLRRWLSGDSVMAYSWNPGAKVARALRRHPVVATACACCGMVAITLGAMAMAERNLLNRPAHMDISSDHRSARLVSLGDRTLHTWSGDPMRGAIGLAELIRPGNRVVLCGWSNAHDPWLHGQLSVGGADDLQRPEWTTPAWDDRLDPPAPWQEPHDAYNVNTALIADVFADQNPPQIVTVHTQDGHPTAIRVYGQDGRVLFQVWHYGSCGRPYWLRGPGLLLLCARDGEHNLATLGCLESGADHPTEILALRPRAGKVLGWTSGPKADPQAEVVWRKWLMPLDKAPWFACSFGTPRDTTLSDSHALLMLDLQPAGTGGISWVIDAAGNILPPPVSTGASDGFKLAHPESTADQFGLGNPPNVPAPSR